MAPKPDEKIGSNENQLNSVKFCEKFKQILKSNHITDHVQEVIIKDAGLVGKIKMSSKF